MKRINETIHNVFIDVNTNEMFFTWRGEQYTGNVIHVWHEPTEMWAHFDGEEEEIPETWLYRVRTNNTVYDIQHIGSEYKIVWDHEREL